MTLGQRSDCAWCFQKASVTGGMDGEWKGVVDDTVGEARGGWPVSGGVCFHSKG